ncbi:MAG: class I SAM-dependent methyltransferase [Actinobacteria bacterium]|nr:class I SAM-dependent methyltransferase [Actinomycetota bacterium]
MSGGARYDEHVAWYEAFKPVLDDVELRCLRDLLGEGSGRCLDLGCGTGVAIPELRRLGWEVVGVDVSEAMLTRAAMRGAELVQAPGESLPFQDTSFDAVVSLWTHTDVDHFPAVMREAARVLRPSSPLVYVGAHPCFVGPHSRFIHGEGTPVLHPGYAQMERYFGGPAVGPDGLRARIGQTHLPLGAFLHAFLDAGLELEAIEELSLDEPERLFPYRVALRFRR